MKPSLDRIDFRPDQCLDAADLAQSSRRASGLLALHTARGHHVWGVAAGYLCALDAGGVVVSPGVAFDAHGRPLVTSKTRTVPLPPPTTGVRPQVFDLVARWADTSDLYPGCDPRELPVERPALRWEQAEPVALARPAGPAMSSRVRPGLDVPIARLNTATTGTPASIDTSQRPVAHGLVRPKIAGARILQASQPASGTYANWTMVISTAAAGFTSNSPTYLVSLDAHPLGDTADLGASNKIKPPALTTRLSWPGPFVSIESKFKDFFTLRVTTITGSGWATNRDRGPATNPVPVTWLGLETPNRPFWLTLAWEVVLKSIDAIGGIS